MNEMKNEPRNKPEVRKGQIRSFTAKTNTITRKSANKKKSVKAPILAIKNKKKLKKKNLLHTRSVERQKSLPKTHIIKKKPATPRKDLMSEDEVEYEQVSGVNERRRRQ